MEILIAVPSEAPGGLESFVSAHFGHCDAFTLVNIRDGSVEKTTVVASPDHADGGCLVPINLLASAHVTAIAVQGMGRRPLLGFLEAGIQPYFANGHRTVNDVVAAYLQGALRPFGPNLACGDDHAHEATCA